MKKMDTTEARQEFSDTLNQVAYGHDRIVLSRRGKDVAVLVPVSDLDLIERCEEQERQAVRQRVARRRRKRST